jgi:predicted Zn-dependent protease
MNRIRLLAALVGIAIGAALALGLIARRDRETPEAAYAAALDAVEAGRFDDADRLLARLAALRAPTPLDHGLRARVAIARGRTDEAIAALRRMPDDHPLADWARQREGQLELRRHRLPAADRALAEAIRLNPENVAARRERIYLLGVQLRRDALDAAFAELAARAPLSPKETWVWCMVPDLVWWNPDESEAYLARCLEADPADRHSRLALAESRRRAARYDAAEATLAPLPGDDPDARALRAELALERSDPARAEGLAAGGPPDHPGLARVRGRLAMGRRDAEAAVRWFRVAHDAAPDRRAAQSDLGRALVLAGRPDEARPYLRAVERLDALGTLLLHAEEKVGAGPNAGPGAKAAADPALWKELSAACEAAGRLPEARAWLALVVRADPLDADAQKGLYRLDGASRKSP